MRQCAAIFYRWHCPFGEGARSLPLTIRRVEGASRERSPFRSTCILQGGCYASSYLQGPRAITLGYQIGIFLAWHLSAVEH